MASFGLLPLSPKASAEWYMMMWTVSAGWSQPTRLGTATLALRATSTGKEWIPSATLQWTGEVTLFH
jgi:hypothetical protein